MQTKTLILVFILLLAGITSVSATFAPFNTTGYNIICQWNSSTALNCTNNEGPASNVGSELVSNGYVQGGIKLNSSGADVDETVYKVKLNPENWTIGLWIRADGWNQTNGFIAGPYGQVPLLQLQSASGNYLNWYIATNNVFGNQMANDTGNMMIGATYTLPFTSDMNGQWHFYAVSFNRTTVKTYVDAQLIGTTESTRSVSPTFTNLSLGMGRDAEGTNFGFPNATFDSLFVVNRTMQATEISSVYSCGNTIFGQCGASQLVIQNITNTSNSVQITTWTFNITNRTFSLLGGSTTGLNLTILNATGAVYNITFSAPNYKTKRVEFNSSIITLSTTLDPVDNIVIRNITNFTNGVQITSWFYNLSNRTYSQIGGTNTGVNGTGIIADGAVYNITITSPGYITKLTEWNSSEIYFNTTLVIANINFTVRARDNYSGYVIQNITVIVLNGSTRSFSGTNGAVVTDMAWMFGQIVNITVLANDSGGYLNRTFININTSSDYLAELVQSVLDVRAFDSINGSFLSHFNVTLRGVTYRTTNGTVNLAVNASSHILSVNSSGYTPVLASITTLPMTHHVFQVNLTYQITVFLLDEMTNLPFDVNGTNETKLTIVCNDTSEQSYTFTGTETNKSIALTCTWDFFKIDVSDVGGSYYRTYIPALDNTNKQFYLINLDTSTAIQTVFQLNDLVGSFVGGHAVIKKFIGSGTVDLVEQLWDVENKVTMYLIQNEGYTVAIVDEDGNERSLGYYVAQSASTNTITVPEIAFAVDTILRDGLVFFFDRSENNSYVKFFYNDTTGGTLGVTFTVYNGTGDVEYTTASAAAGYSFFTFATNNASAYRVCFNATHSVLDPISECRVYGGFSILGPIGSLSGFTGEELVDVEEFQNFIVLVLNILVVMMASRAQMGGTLALLTFLDGIFIRVGWLNLGTPGKNTILLVFMGIVAFLTFLTESGKK